MTAPSFHEIGLRWPDAVVYWDRDVAPTLDWEPRFVERDGVLWAVCDADAAPVPSTDVRLECYRNCRCRVWEPTLKQWWTHAKWNRRSSSGGRMRNGTGWSHS